MPSRNWLPRGRRPRALRSIALAAACSIGCSSPSTDDDARARRVAFAEHDWDEALRDGRVEALAQALAQSHAAVRDALGPHRLHYVASSSLVDPTAEDGGPLFEVDSPAVHDRSVRDELELVWSPVDGRPRFRLRQSNEHERGREVVLTDDVLHTRQRHRPWVHYPVETDIHERWLDDAQKALHDVIELAAPRLQLEPVSGDDGSVLTLRLRRSDTERTELRRAGATSHWRQGVQIEQVSGEIVVDASTGAWRRAHVNVRYALEAADGRMLRGTVEFEGAVEPLPAKTAAIQAPADSEPLPERTRLQVERQELLDGLAAPR